MKLTIFRSRDEHIEVSERVRGGPEDRAKDKNKTSRMDRRRE